MLYNFYPSEHVVIKISNQLSLHYTYTCCLPSIVNIFSGKISTTVPSSRLIRSSNTISTATGTVLLKKLKLEYYIKSLTYIQ